VPVSTPGHTRELTSKPIHSIAIQPSPPGPPETNPATATPTTARLSPNHGSAARASHSPSPTQQEQINATMHHAKAHHPAAQQKGQPNSNASLNALPKPDAVFKGTSAWPGPSGKPPCNSLSFRPCGVGRSAALSDSTTSSAGQRYWRSCQ